MAGGLGSTRPDCVNQPDRPACAWTCEDKGPRQGTDRATSPEGCGIFESRPRALAGGARGWGLGGPMGLGRRGLGSIRYAPPDRPACAWLGIAGIGPRQGTPGPLVASWRLKVLLRSGWTDRVGRFPTQGRSRLPLFRAY